MKKTVIKSIVFILVVFTGACSSYTKQKITDTDSVKSTEEDTAKDSDTTEDTVKDSDTTEDTAKDSDTTEDTVKDSDTTKDSEPVVVPPPSGYGVVSGGGKIQSQNYKATISIGDPAPGITGIKSTSYKAKLGVGVTATK